MAACVEEMIYVQRNRRDYPWWYSEDTKHLAHLFSECIDVEDAFKLVLDWTVSQRPVFTTTDNRELMKKFLMEQGCSEYIASIAAKQLNCLPAIACKENLANVRDDKETALGVTGVRYKVFQNRSMCDFVVELLGQGAKVVTGGVLSGGQDVWLLLQNPSIDILGDEIESYILVTNNHCGKNSFRALFTPVRVVCKNTLAAAISGAKQSYNIRHTTNLMARVAEAKHVLGLCTSYTDTLKEYGETAVNIKISDAEVKYFLDKLFPVDEKAKNKELQEKRAEENKEAFYVCYAAPDIAKFQGTAWGVFNAMADLVDHSLPHKDTADFSENNFMRIAGCHPLLNKMVDALCVA